MAQHRDDLRLRCVIRIMAGDQVADEILIQLSAAFIQDADEVAHHQEELAHRCDVQHGRVHGDDHAGRRVNGTQGQKAERRRRVQDDDIIVCIDLRKGELQPLEENRTRTRLVCQDTGRFMLVFHDLQIAWNKVDPFEICLANDLADRAPLGIVIAQGSIDRLVRTDIHLGLGTEHRGQGRLRIQVQRENAITLERQIVGKVDAGRRFRTATLEIRDRDDLEMLSRAAARKKPQRFRGLLPREQLAKLIDLSQGIDAVVVLEPARDRSAPFGGHELQGGIGYGCELRHFVCQKRSKGLLRLRRVHARSELLQLCRQKPGMTHDLAAGIFLGAKNWFCSICYRHVFLLAAFSRFAGHCPPKIEHDSPGPSRSLGLTKG
ncbi:protein of unknown function (plasmid) [Shinella sp. WSC3-e]|nr:protein of unknown function [Shinella sp. WSC3-e]